MAIFLGTSIVRGSVIYSNLVSFNGTNGASPGVAPIQDTDGSFYGTTSSGGTNGNYGTLWRMTPEGSLSSLVSFSGTNGAYPGSGPSQLIKATDGNFYGTTFKGGTPDGTNSYGTIFRFSSNGTFSTLISFTGTNPPYPGANPNQLVQGMDGNLYGTTFSGGSTNKTPNFGTSYHYGYGTVFQVSTNGAFTTLAILTGTNGVFPGINPSGRLVQTGEGSLYGTTQGGGNGDFGTVFRVTTNGSLVWSFSFGNTNGAEPQAGLALGFDGNLYGVTSLYSLTPQGAPVGSTIFKITTNGTQSVLHFLGPSASFPNPVAALIQATDGNFYGTTLQGGNGNGTIFSVTPSGAFSTLYTFIGGSNSGASPFGGLLQAADNAFYGTASSGGLFTNGTIFRLSVPLPAVLQTPVFAPDGSLSLSWAAVSGQTYQLEYSTNLTSTNWMNLDDAVVATNGIVTEPDPSPTDPQRFYRAVDLPF